MLWNLEQSNKATISLKSEHPILSLSFSPDGRYLASGDDSDNASITVWDLGTGVRTLQLRWPHGPLKDSHVLAGWQITGNCEFLRATRSALGREIGEVGTDRSPDIDWGPTHSRSRPTAAYWPRAVATVFFASGLLPRAS